MKPDIVYRPKTPKAPKAKPAPKGAGKAASEAPKATPKAPEPREGGHYVWVPHGMEAKLQRIDARKKRMRTYMKAYRAKPKAT